MQALFLKFWLDSHLFNLQLVRWFEGYPVKSIQIFAWDLFRVVSTKIFDSSEKHLNPRLFNPKINPKLLKHELSNPGFSTMNVLVKKSGVEKSGVLERWHFNPGLFNPRLYNHELFIPMVEKSRVENFMVEKFIFEKFGVKRLKSRGLRCLSTAESFQKYGMFFFTSRSWR